jgi:pyruvate dehydrogenase E1 component alpha subunit
MNALFAELYGKESGANGGMAGSQEISADDVRFYSGAILSGTTGIAVGTAMALQLQRKDAIVCAGFGDGATDEGVFWEAVGLAAVRRLPIVFVCENNGYATYSPQWKRQRHDNLHQRVASFGIESRAVFGNDVVGLFQTLKDAVDGARSGKGPFFVEAYTYRWNGHVGPEDDDAAVGYRPAAEIAFWKERCPIQLLEDALVQSGILAESQKQQILSEIDAEVEEAFTFAKTSPFPHGADWAALNWRADSPVADALLCEFDEPIFDQDQPEAIPGPY